MGKRNRGRQVVQCLRCGGLKIHEARGLCKCCYNHLREQRCRHGESLDQYPKLGGFGQWSGFTTAVSETKADQIRRKLDPNHIPMKEAS